jgi:hypothetical protein
MKFKNLFVRPSICSTFLTYKKYKEIIVLLFGLTCILSNFQLTICLSFFCYIWISSLKCLFYYIQNDFRVLFLLFGDCSNTLICIYLFRRFSLLVSLQFTSILKSPIFKNWQILMNVRVEFDSFFWLNSS